MLFLVSGLPSAFAEWCDKLVMGLAALTFGPTALIHADTLQDIALSVIETGASQGVVSSRRPGGRLRAALVENGQPFIVALDDPRMTLLELVLGQGIELAAAVQAVASSCAAVADYMSAPGALVLERERDWAQPVSTAAAIARHLEIAIDHDATVALVDGLDAGGPSHLPDDAIAWWNGREAAEQEMIIGALAPYIRVQGDDEPASITWARGLFFLGDRANERATLPIDITGRARLLVGGPDIMLPAGSWSLSLSVRFSRSAIEHTFHVEVWTDRQLASGSLQPRQEGEGEIVLDFTIDDSMDRPVAIKVSSTRAAFDGAIALVGATLLRAIPTADDKARAQLTLAGA